MNQAAIPKYFGGDFSAAPPGHRFSLYFPVWQGDWTIGTGAKKDALDKVCAANDAGFTAKLIARAQANAESLGDACLTRHARATSPFVTGLGLEHPVENGFAFLNPYGVPYLPGSSIKGVLRKAAEELALGLYADTRGWNILMVWHLFGFEAGSGYWDGKRPEDAGLREEVAHLQQAYLRAIEENTIDAAAIRHFACIAGNPQLHPASDEDCRAFLRDLAQKPSQRQSLRNRGALQFWDVIPELANGKLEVDVLTPHFGDYYRGTESPHDSGQPQPNFFLTVPPGSRFAFHITCACSTLPETLRGAWRKLVKEALEHAFDWLGFGAKTAVGYGQMEALSEQEIEADAAQAQRAALHCPWVDEQLEQICTENKLPAWKKPDALHGRLLALAWQGVDDPLLKARALADIRARWQAEGWWNDPPGKAARKAKDIYGENPE